MANRTYAINDKLIVISLTRLEAEELKSAFDKLENSQLWNGRLKAVRSKLTQVIPEKNTNSNAHNG